MGSTGMTLKQMAKARFFDAVAAYRVAKEALKTEQPGAAEAFIRASVLLHAAKGGVPKTYWRLANQAVRG